MMKLILDTDLDTDCDDTGALALLHNFAQRGEAEILGVICSIPKVACALCASAINDAYGRAELPVGLVRVADWQRSPRFNTYQEMLADLARQSKPFYNETIGGEWAQQHPGVQYPCATVLYRQLLADADDATVTICAIGTLTALQQLLDSPGDSISPLSGRELIGAKVVRLVSMALGTYPRGKDGFNWRMDTIGAAAVLDGWPVPITVSELGGTVLVGRRFIDAADVRHPVRRAFEIWLDNWGRAEGQTDERPSWDQIALLRAVRGCGEILEEHGGGAVRLDAATGEHRWSEAGRAPERSWLTSRVPDAELARIVEDLMIESLERDN
jgi:hypothetical protein